MVECRPFAEKSPSPGSYQYTANNPIANIGREKNFRVAVQLGLYKVRIIDMDQQKAQRCLGMDEGKSNEVKSVTFPVLKFNDEARINVCINCTDQEINEQKKIVEKFKSEYSDMLNSADMNAIASSFMKGITIYIGHGRYRD